MLQNYLQPPKTSEVPTSTFKQKTIDHVHIAHDGQSSDESFEMKTSQRISRRSKKTWDGKAFIALDRENRGYLLKHEIMEHFELGGVMEHHGLKYLITALDKKSYKTPIHYEEFKLFASHDNFFKRVIEHSLIIP